MEKYVWVERAEDNGPVTTRPIFLYIFFCLYSKNACHYNCQKKKENSWTKECVEFIIKL